MQTEQVEGTILDQCPESVQTHYAVMRLRRRSLAQVNRLKAKQKKIGKKIKATRKKLAKVKTDLHKELVEGNRPTQDDIDTYVEAHLSNQILGRRLQRKYRQSRCSGADISDFTDAARVYDARAAEMELAISGEEHPDTDPLSKLDPSVLAAIELLRAEEQDGRQRKQIEGAVLEI